MATRRLLTPNVSTSALRQSRMVFGWKILEYAGLAVFTITVPRLMGPHLYGGFAATMATVALLTMFTSLGAQATFGRFVPEYEQRGDRRSTEAVFQQILVSRIAMAGLGAVGLLIFLPRVLPSATLPMAAWAAGALLLGSMSITHFQFFFGLNRLGRWLAHDALVRFLIIGFILVLGGITSLSRAVAALCLAEAVLLLLGLAWAKEYFAPFRRETFTSTWRSHVLFGIHFFGANLLLMGIWRGGDIAVLLLAKNQSEVAFFNIANSMAMAFGVLLGQLATMVVPSVTARHVQGDQAATEEALAWALKYLTVAAFAFAFAIHATAHPLVRLLLGPAFARVAPNLEVLAIGLVPIALVRTAVSIAMVHKTPSRALRMAAAGLAGFVIAAAVVVPRWGSLGASIAVGAGVAIAGVAAQFQFSLGTIQSRARFWTIIVVGVVGVAVLYVPHMGAVATGSAALLWFMAALFGTRAVTVAELRRLVRAVVS